MHIDWADRVRWDERGLAPVIVQDRVTGDVLMLAWTNEEALRLTLRDNEMWYWSRSRAELWHKGATSGQTQRVHSLHLDCDGDAILAVVEQRGGGACHRGTATCWDREDGGIGVSGPRHVLSELLRLIDARDRERPAGAYTTRLLEGGVDRAGKKVGEEATEVVIAAKNAVAGKGTAELAEESADLIYHLLVLWRTAGFDPADAIAALERRR